MDLVPTILNLKSAVHVMSMLSNMAQVVVETKITNLVNTFVARGKYSIKRVVLLAVVLLIMILTKLFAAVESSTLMYLRILVVVRLKLMTQ